MKSSTLTKSCLALATFSLMLTSCDKDVTQSTQEPTAAIVTPVSSEGDIIPNQYIVMMKAEAIAPAISYLDGPVADRTTKSKLMQQKGAIVTNQLQNFLIESNIPTTKVSAYYTAVATGFAIQLTDEEKAILAKSDQVELIEHDRIEELPKFVVENSSPTTGRAQTTPCGITNAGGAANSSTSTSYAWIIDTGIDLDHPDLNVVTDTRFAKTFVKGGKTADDCNGHGTHVAGTVGAIDNNVGVVGVSAGAPVVPVKVFNCRGRTTSGAIMSGLDHVANNASADDVVNLSLGGYYGSGCENGSSYKSVLQGLGNAGVRVASAAGNSSADAALYQPACVNGNNVYTVASMTCSKGWSSFSNFGVGPVDYIATGSSVLSTYPGGYATLSGTSMACPHVAGIMHARKAAPSTSGNVSFGGDNYPIAVR
jgi:subtilisin family serine protease